MSAGLERGGEAPVFILPDYTATSVLDIDFEHLRNAGKTHVLVDLDLTLRVSQFVDACEPELVERLQSEKEAGNIASITIASNGKSDLTSYAEALGADHVQQPFVQDDELIMKPDPRFFQAALDQLDITADEAVVVGDRYLLDIVGAHETGITTVLVEPLAADYPLDLLRRTRRQDRQAHELAKIAFTEAEIRSHIGEDSPDDKAIEIARLFGERLEKAKPYLFSLADEVIDAYPEQQWDLLLVDDTGGRLVGRFLRRALQEQGIHIPTTYVCGTSSLRKRLPEDAYKKLADKITDRPNPPAHPLVVSEIAGTGATLQFFDSQMRPHFEAVDYAVASARYPHAVDVEGAVYYGGHGRKSAEAITSTFERVGQRSVSDRLGFFVINSLPYSLYSNAYRHARRFADATDTTSRTYALTNIETPSYNDTVLPLAQRSEDDRFRGVAKYCSTLIDRLASEFTEARSFYVGQDEAANG